MIAPGTGFAHVRLALAVLVLASVAGCTPGQTTYQAQSAEAGMLREARQQLIADLRECSARHSYDPNDANLPENALAPNEREWRQCAYDAAYAYTEVNRPLALDFATLIDQDEGMTAALAAGEMTRTERRERLRVLIEAVHEKELKQLQSLDGDTAREQELVRQVTEGLRGLH